MPQIWRKNDDSIGNQTEPLRAKVTVVCRKLAKAATKIHSIFCFPFSLGKCRNDTVETSKSNRFHHVAPRAQWHFSNLFFNCFFGKKKKVMNFVVRKGRRIPNSVSRRELQAQAYTSVLLCTCTCIARGFFKSILQVSSLPLFAFHRIVQTKLKNQNFFFHQRTLGVGTHNQWRAGGLKLRCVVPSSVVCRARRSACVTVRNLLSLRTAGTNPTSTFKINAVLSCRSSQCARNICLFF